MESGWFFAGKKDSSGGNVLMCMEVNSLEMELGMVDVAMLIHNLNTDTVKDRDMV